MLKLRSNCLILYADKSSETPLVEEDMQYLQRPATVNSSLYRTRTAAAAEFRLHGGCYNRRLSGLMGDVTKIYFQAQLFNRLFCRLIYLTIFQIVTDSNGGSSRVQTAWRLLQSKIVGIDGRCDENLFSGTIAQQTRIFA